MRLKYLTILFSFFFAGMTFAQSHTISYTFSVDGCGDIQNLQLFSGIMHEGDNIPFDAYTFPEENQDAQFFYNLLVGGSIEFPDGCLTENIHCDIKLAGLCDLDLSNLPADKDILKLVYLIINVTGEKSGVHNPNEYYYLSNNLETNLKIPLSRILPFLNYLSYTVDDFTPYYISPDNQMDLNGIRKVVDDNYLSIYSKHFSTIGVGFKIDTTQSPTSVNTTSITPDVYQLNQNYPNPFNPSTKISYTLPDAGFTKLTVYNSLGEVVKSLVNENQSAGNYTINFNAANLPSGLYFYSLSSGNFTQTNKMILMK